MRLAKAASLALLLATSGWAADAAAQEGGFALNQLQPAPAGDVFFGVPSPYARGHLDPNAYFLFDYAHRPIRLTSTTGDDVAVVENQAYIRLAGSISFWERLLVSVDVPLSILQGGDDPGLAGTTFTTLEAPQMGDVRVGVRGRIFGDDGGPFQLGLGGMLMIPSGSQEQYSGEGSVRGRLHAIIGGRVGSDIGFAYSAFGGTELRGGDTPHAVTYGAGAALLVADSLFQVGPELYASTALGDSVNLSSMPVTMASAGTNAELMLSSKLRFLEGLTIGAAGGPGISSAVGTPTFRVMGLVGWTPMPGPAKDDEGDQIAQIGDKDDDGINDDIDACPDLPGEPNADPTKDGCPPSDRDGDGVLDGQDACPGTPGERNADVTKNGCPKDSDGDGFHDGIDACLMVEGDYSDDPDKVGCPADEDNDTIVDSEDACPKQPGPVNEDPALTGCPADPDNDGIKYADDACPFESGDPHPNPKQHGCPKFVRVEDGEIKISQRIEFETYGDSLAESVTPDSRQVLDEVARAIKEHPEITQLEVQGHTDDSGTEEFNLDLSQRRAETIRNWLINERGIDANILTAKGYGMNKPIADNRTRLGRQANRRVQFVILATKKQQ